MTTKIIDKKLTGLAIIMDPSDQVAVAKENLAAATRLEFHDDVMEMKSSVRRGQRFAICDIPAGEYVRQFGFPFGRSKGIAKGEIISRTNIDDVVPEVSQKDFTAPGATAYQERLLQKTFLGYWRKNGTVGTRNYYLILPTSMCASETVLQVAASLEQDKSLFEKYPSLDGIIGIHHTEGCGCDAGLSIDRLMRILKGYIRHPNVGGCLVIDLGCEQTNYRKMNPYMQSTLAEGLKPVDWITIEESGGVAATRKKAEALVRQRLAEVADIQRKPAPLEKLIVGTECGASDSFSGITANPIIGNVADQVIYAKGSAILSEIPEMVGTFDMLFPRFRSAEVARKFQAFMDWYVDLARRLGGTLEANLVPKNIEGGLVNNYIKSLGAVLKGGTTVIEDVIDYGEPVQKRGLSIMQGPGSDLESVTGIVASGANVVCFSTGQGTPTGNAICPVVKVASTDAMYQRLCEDMDFNGGRLLTEKTTIEELGEELLALVIEVASGRQTAAERSKQRQFQVWTAGKISL